MEGVEVLCDDGPPVVDGLSQPIQDAPQERRPHGNLKGPVGGHHVASGPHLLQVPQGHQEDAVLPKAHHLGVQRAGPVSEADVAQVAHPDVRPLGLRHQPHHLHHPAVDLHQLRLTQVRLQDGEEIGPGRCAVGPAHCPSPPAEPWAPCRPPGPLVTCCRISSTMPPTCSSCVRHRAS